MVCGLFDWSKYVHVFIVYLYIYWRSSYQEGRVEIPLTGLTPHTFGACPKPGLGFQTSYIMVFLCSVSCKCSFCWSWCICWPSLVKLSLYNYIVVCSASAIASTHMKTCFLLQFFIFQTFKQHLYLFICSQKMYYSFCQCAANGDMSVVFSGYSGFLHQ